MPSTLTWLDHDATERERMNRVLALFQERTTVDELGLGGIRDSIADRLFPGTSTIQTRLRYFLFTAWTYRLLEEKKTRSSEVAEKARKLELRIAEHLLGTDEAGIFGRLARGDLKRLPSSVYWGGLGQWGIRIFNGSQDQYHRSLDRIYEQRKMARTRWESAEDPDVRLGATWHAALPPAPEGFPDDVSIDIEHEEAQFLLDRIRASHPHSYLRVLAEAKQLPEVDFPWDLADIPGTTTEHETLLTYAQSFSEIHHGATILYNLMLAEHADRADLADQHSTRLDEWLNGIDIDACSRWDLDDFWRNTVNPGHSITPAARDFVTNWRAVVVRSRDLRKDETARQLIRHRESLLKGPRSKFTNRQLLDEWQGYAGMLRLDYRWFRVRALLADLHAGLRR